MTYKAKLEKAKMGNITIPSEILEKDIVGVYKFFAVLEDEKICFYIGKSTNIRERLLSSNGHIHLFFKESEKLVPSEIKYYLGQLPEGVGKGEREYWENNYKRDR